MTTTTQNTRRTGVILLVIGLLVGLVLGVIGTRVVRADDSATAPETAAPSESTGTETAGTEAAEGVVPLAHDVSGSGPLVVLIHGITEDRRSWDPVVPQLSRFATVVRVDLRGHGESPRPEDGTYTPATLAADVRAVVEQYDGADDAVIVGHSLGGIIATAYGADYPASAIVNLDQPLELGAMQVGTLAMEDQLRGDEFTATMVAMFEGMYGDLPEDDIDRLRAIREPQQDVVLGVWSVLLDMTPAELDEVVADYTAVPSDLRYIAVQGMAVPEGYTEWLADRIPQTEYQDWGEVGHYPQIVDSERFVTLVREVVEQA